ncbi:hypothetical protein BsIDN1_08690 [Bacillus safensis]|uniref:Uncharacterized protein n=1 Tax=Bacillus safensis TaxID=561879 RepID=A0A5S9M2N3_BACIA|nr:hypothetical protein BsIDN1_08690 [Bacillus safensis]
MIAGSDTWVKTLGKYDSNDRAAEVLQDIVKTIEANQDATVTYRMPNQKKKPPFHCEKVVFVYDGVFL